MKIVLTFRSGARAGQSETLALPYIQIGRHPQCDVRFDSERDLDVSARHAAIVRSGELYLLRDLGSTNGTWINGERLGADHVLAHGDVIRFGREGPALEVRLQRPPGPVPAAATPAAATPVPGTVATPAPPSHHLRPTPAEHTVRVEREVARQTATLRRTSLMLLLLLAVLGGAYLWQGLRSAARVRQERARLLQGVDSLSAALAGVTVRVSSLQGALDSAARETSRLRQDIGRGGSVEELNRLRRRLETAQQRQSRLASAATLDAAGISAANIDAVCVVLVQFPDGSTASGSGFAVASNGNAGLVLTNRHVVVAPDGGRPSRIGVIFNGSNQNFQAQLLAVHGDSTADVALLRVPVRRGVPVVKGLVTASPPVRTGDAVAVLGYPLGFQMEMGEDWRTVGVSAALSTGIVSKSLPERLVIVGYGAPGASGSPVFNREGQVVGILVGGQGESNGRIVLAVPIKYGLELLPRME